MWYTQKMEYRKWKEKFKFYLIKLSTKPNLGFVFSLVVCEEDLKINPIVYHLCFVKYSYA